MPSIELMHRTIGDLSKPPADVPTGVWYKLRAIKISVRDRTITPKNGEEYETKEYTLSVEPVTPGPGVSPDELAATDERTGKPAWEGKRIFCRFTESFGGQMRQLGGALAAMGFGPGDDFDEIVAENLVKGKVFSGDVQTRHYKKNDGSDGSDQYIANFAKEAAGGGFEV